MVPTVVDDSLYGAAVDKPEDVFELVWIGSRATRQYLEGVMPALRTLAGTDSSPSKHVRRSERFERLQEAIRRLSPDHRRVILLVRIEGLTIREVAERMERSVSSVKNLLLRAMRAMRETLPDTESLTLPPRRLESEEDDDE